MCSVCAACADHVNAAQVPAGLHVPSSRATQARSPLHCHPDHLLDRSLDHQNYQTDLNHFSSHGLCHHLSLLICCSSDEITIWNVGAMLN